MEGRGVSKHCEDEAPLLISIPHAYCLWAVWSWGEGGDGASGLGTMPAPLPGRGEQNRNPHVAHLVWRQGRRFAALLYDSGNLLHALPGLRRHTRDSESVAVP